MPCPAPAAAALDDAVLGALGAQLQRAGRLGHCGLGMHDLAEIQRGRDVHDARGEQVARDAGTTPCNMPM
jgi:hypothetical protein